MEQHTETVQASEVSESTKNDEYKSVLLRLDTTMCMKVDDFKADRGFSNRTEAIRYLMTLGLKASDSEGVLKLRMDRVEEALKRNGLL